MLLLVKVTNQLTFQILFIQKKEVLFLLEMLLNILVGIYSKIEIVFEMFGLAKILFWSFSVGCPLLTVNMNYVWSW